MTSTRPTLRPRPTRTSGPEKPNKEGNRRLNGGQPNPVQPPAFRRDGKFDSNSAKPILEPEASTELRDRLLAELADVGSEDEAAIWAHRSLRAKNGLTVSDAQRVEEAFQAILMTIATRVAAAAPQKPAESGQPLTSHGLYPAESENRPPSKVIDKSVLALPEPRRVRDRDHLKSVAQQPCLICGRRPSDAHHLRFAQSQALGRKVSDEFSVPLCRGHHREVHRCGDEAAWWSNAGIEPILTARALWLETHPLPIVADGVRPAPECLDIKSTDSRPG